MNRRSALGACAALAAWSLAERAASAQVKIERVVTKIGRNHGHELVVSPADVKAGVTKTYDLTGTSGHAHEVTLGADDFKQLAAGQVLRMPATRYNGVGHLHRVLVKVAPLVDPPESVNVCEVTFSGKDDHELVVSAPDLAAGAEKVFDIQGIAPHAHALTLAAGDFEKLKAGAQIKVRSTAGDSDDHTHLVFVRYSMGGPESPPKPPRDVDRGR
jgi:hypothetical protein